MAGQGKSANQKLKTYLVMQYLLRNTDERHPALMQDILEYLREDCGIKAEYRGTAGNSPRTRNNHLQRAF